MIHVIIVLICCFVSVPAWAHVKWFVSGEVAQRQGDFYSITDQPVLIWIALAMAILQAALLLSYYLDRPNPPAVKWRKYAFGLFRILIGISLFNTAYEGHIIAPHYLVEKNTTLLLQLMESAVGVCFIAGVLLELMSIVLLIMYIGAGIMYGPIEVLDYFNIAGIAIFMFCNNVSDQHWRKKLQPYALPLLRVMTGVALIVLAFSEKLLQPSLGQEFLANYHWNFMPLLGFGDFSDNLFILSAGFVELLIGAVLILGVMTRITVVVLAIFMTLSNSYLFLHGDTSAAMIELIGHLPIIATAIVLLLYGSGRKLKLIHKNEPVQYFEQ